jgi:hypothetical protein
MKKIRFVIELTDRFEQIIRTIAVDATPITGTPSLVKLPILILLLVLSPDDDPYIPSCQLS